MDEILNIEYHKKRLFLMAVNRSSNYDEAAAKLGVSIRTFYRLKNVYGIKKKYKYYITKHETQLR